MKKAKLLCLSTLTALLLTGCGGAKASFKEVSVEKPLTDAETVLLLAQVKSALKTKLSGFTLKMSSFEKTDISEENYEEERSITFYDGYYVHSERSTKDELKLNGLVSKEEHKVVGDRFQYDDKYVASYSVLDGEEVTVNLNQAPAETVYENGLNTVENLFNGLEAYKDSKGDIIFVDNAYAEKYTPVEFGSETKVVHTIDKDQTVIKIDKDNLVKSYYRYSSSETNKDPATDEIGNKTALVYERKVSGEFSYKDRKSNEKGYADIKAEIQNKYAFTAAPSLRAKIKDTETNVPLKTQAQSKRLGYAKFEYFVAVEFETGVAPLDDDKVLSFYLQASIKKFGAEGDAEAVTINVSNVDLKGKVDFKVAQDVDLLIKFTVELTADKASQTVSDVSVYLP